MSRGDEEGPVGPDEPLRLADALKLAFRPGDMTVSGLRRERDRGTLRTWIVAGREFTTLGDIRRMHETLAMQRENAATLKRPPAIDEHMRRHKGSPGTEKVSGARAALLKKLEELSKPSTSGSSRKTAAQE